MKKYNLKITVHEIKGECPIFKRGDYFLIADGFRLRLGNTEEICMHSLNSIMPYYVALSRGIQPDSLGLSERGSDFAYVQCLDPCEKSGGGTVIFKIEVQNG